MPDSLSALCDEMRKKLRIRKAFPRKNLRAIRIIVSSRGKRGRRLHESGLENSAPANGILLCAFCLCQGLFKLLGAFQPARRSTPARCLPSLQGASYPLIPVRCLPSLQGASYPLIPVRRLPPLRGACYPLTPVRRLLVRWRPAAPSTAPLPSPTRSALPPRL